MELKKSPAEETDAGKALRKAYSTITRFTSFCHQCGRRTSGMVGLETAVYQVIACFINSRIENKQLQPAAVNTKNTFDPSLAAYVVCNLPPSRLTEILEPPTRRSHYARNHPEEFKAMLKDRDALASLWKSVHDAVDWKRHLVEELDAAYSKEIGPL